MPMKSFVLPFVMGLSHGVMLLSTTTYVCFVHICILNQHYQESTSSHTSLMAFALYDTSTPHLLTVLFFNDSSCSRMRLNFSLLDASFMFPAAYNHVRMKYIDADDLHGVLLHVNIHPSYRPHHQAVIVRLSISLRGLVF